MDEKILWQTALAQIELELSKPIFQTFFKSTTIKSRTGTTIEIACPNTATKERIQSRHYSQVKSVLDQLTKIDNNIIFTVESILKPLDDLGPLFSSPPKESYREAVMTPSFSRDPKETGLYPQYTFDNFVVGPNNNLAFAVAQAIATSPGKVYNPFFLYAGVGLGKTHLIQAIGNQIFKSRQSLKVLYCTGETFTNELLESIYRSKQFREASTNFRKKFRNVDVLIIDDIQFIAGRETTQEEFYNTFNALYPAGKQIILASDRPPKEIARLEERLASRFSSGMIADMQAPDVDIKNAILRRKREVLGVQLPDEIIDFIAKTSPSNIRDLEGAFLQVIAFNQTQGGSVNLEQVKSLLGRNIGATEERVTPKRIINAVENFFNVKSSDLKGPCRKREFVIPRQIAMYLIKTLTDTPLMQIGDIIGGRDHTTIIHGSDKIQKELIENPKIQEDVRKIKTYLNLASA